MKRQIVIVLTCLGVGFVVGWSQRRVVIEEKVVTKTITKRDVVTKIIEKPDGSKETTIEEKERTKENIAAQKDEERGVRSMWSGGVYRTPQGTGVTLDRRLIGSLHVGGFTFIEDNLKFNVGLGLRIEF